MSEQKPNEMTPTESRQLATIQPPTAALIVVQADDDSKMIERWLSSAPSCVTNLPAGDPETEFVMARAMGKADRQTRNCVNQPLRIVGYVVHPADLVDKETGEVQTKLRAVMVMEDGSMVSTMSSGVLRVLRVLAQTRGKGRWNPPVEATIQEYPLEGGASYCVMNVSKAQPTTAKKK